MIKFLTCIIFVVSGAHASSQFSSQDLSKLQDSLEKKSYYSAELPRPHPEFVYTEESKQNIIAVLAKPQDLLPYRIAQVAGVQDVVSEIRVLQGKTVGKFINFVDNSSLPTPETDNIYILLKNKIEKNYGALTFKDLLNENFSIDQKSAELVSSLLDKEAAQKLYLFNYLTDQKDFNYTNLLFQVNSKGKIIPIAIDLEHAFSTFSKARNGLMYKSIFKEALDQSLSTQTVKIVQEVISGENFKRLIEELKKDESSTKAASILEKKIDVLRNIFPETQGVFSISALYTKAEVELY